MYTQELHRLVADLMWWHGFMVGSLVQLVIWRIGIGIWRSQIVPETNRFRAGEHVLVRGFAETGTIAWVNDHTVGVTFGDRGPVRHFEIKDLTAM